jgi:hypothetical protein
VHGPIVAIGPAWGSFATRTVVRFEGRKFAVVGTTPWVDVHGELERVEGSHGRALGRAVGRVMQPVGEMLIPRAEAQGTPIAERILTNFANDLAEKIVTRLDNTTAVEKSLNRLFPESKDWVFRMSSDDRFIQAAYGPRVSQVPVLPANPAGFKDVRMEVWVHSANKEAQELAKLSRLPLARELVHAYVRTILPELASLTENRSVDAVGPWLVISLGAPNK